MFNLSQLTLEGSLRKRFEILDMTSGVKGMQRELNVFAGVNVDLSDFRSRDVKADFRFLPFRDGSFNRVLFDPPFLVRRGLPTVAVVDPISGMGPGMAVYKYGVYPDVVSLSTTLYRGFREAVRVLRPGGELIGKWSDSQKSLTWYLGRVDRRLRLVHIVRRRSAANTKANTFYCYFASER